MRPRLGRLFTRRAAAAPAPDPREALAEEIAASGLFDAEYYVRCHPEVRAAGWPALRHYLLEGEARGLRPNPLFDPAWYAERHPDVTPGEGRLLVHYAREGADAGAPPGPHFDPAWYATVVPGGIPSGVNPLAHWLSVGRARGIDPHPLFDGAWYLARHPSAAAVRLDPIAHWIEVGAAAGLSPHPLFDAAWYVARHPEAAGDPLRHWREVGAREGFSPHPLFDAAWYRGRHPQVARRGLDPLRHYVEEGAARGLLTHPLFDPDWYRARHPELPDPISALVHCAERRGAFGAEPSPWFAWFARFFLPDPRLPWLRAEDGPLGPFLEGALRFGPPPTLRFPTCEAPVASVVIPVWGKPSYTVACLRSLAAARTALSYEVVLVDDASPGIDYREVLAHVPGLRVLRNPSNLGFVGTCNRGAAEARGRFLVFLNNDTVVTDGWLEALLASFDALPGTGIAGPKLLYPSGRTGEAGAIVWRDGSCWNYGRRHRPDSPEVEYARDVDYVSGAALAIERKLFEALDGFDPAYAPGYYEDVDLAFRVRAAGRRVVYQPTSEVIHFEGVSSGLDPSTGMKAGQVANRATFVARFGAAIASHRDAAPEVLDREKDRFASGEALVVDVSTPTPGRDARSLRLLHLLRILGEEGLRPTFVPADGSAPEPWRSTLRRHGIRVLTPPSVDAFLSKTDERFDVCMVCRPRLAARLLPAIRARWPHARTLFDAADLLDPPALAALREGTSPESALARAARAAADHADVTLVATSPDEWKPDESASRSLLLVPWIYETRGEPAPWDARADLLFVPGRQAAAVDALLWLREEILPRIVASLHAVRVFVPDHPALRPLIAGHPAFVALEEAMLEPPPPFDRFRLALAPLRFGPGLAEPIQPALAAGLPCVASPRAAQGIPHAVRAALSLAEDAAGFASEVTRLYDDRAAWDGASAASRAAIAERFAFGLARERLRGVLAEGVATP